VKVLRKKYNSFDIISSSAAKADVAINSLKLENFNKAHTGYVAA